MAFMQTDIDVLQLLKGFASRNQINTVDYRQFVQYVQRHVKSGDQSIPVFRDLATRPDSVLVPRLYQLSRDKQISLFTSGNLVEKIVLPTAFTEAVLAEYNRMEENPDIPFPDEEGLRLSIPQEWVRIVSVDTDLVGILESAGEVDVPLYRLMFPDGLGSVIILSVSVGERLLEYAVFKLRQYLRKGNNKDYIQQRLLGAFAGKESLLKDNVNSILLKPFDVISEMKNGKSDFTFPFWAYLASSIRKDLSSKVERTPEETAAYQAAYIVDVFNTFYKGRTQRVQERESAFKALGVSIRKPPYTFSVDDVAGFKDGQGRPLLGKYTREELEDWIREKTTTAQPGCLPELLVVVGKQGRRTLVSKDRLLPLAVKLLHEARGTVKTRITEDWRRVLYAYGTLECMQDDAAFRRDLDARLEQASPTLAAILEAKFPSLVYSEVRASKDDIAGLDRYFGEDRIAPSDVLLDLDRKRLLTDVRMLLPIWYTIPVLSWFVALWKRLGKGRERKRKLASELRAEARTDAARQGSGDRATEFAVAAAKVEKRVVPEGYTLDEYLAALVGKWNVNLDLSAKANLTEDINSLVRDYLRNILRTMKPSAFTAERLETLAANLADTPTLLKIRNHTALEEYIKLYMLRLLKR